MSALTISLFLSCEKKTSETVNVDGSLSDTVVIPASNEPVESSTLQTCYMEAISKDSVFLSLDDNLGTITGKMRYKNFEKDSSFGDVAGIQNADTLKLMYTFESEGKTSDREIYFLRKGDKLMEATGEYTTDGSTSKYTNPSKLKYDGHQLQQIDCTNFDKKFTSK
ncbi:hypothetical protein [Chryseobacterium sp. SNU WT5]|uniref:hypothetical protein n=1 Tax=Chryseobacterium sp. SNU WT5 TaxID=2594269 RepID=UPI001E2CFD68|nr:hypothetical protein [Chryseobacterium sp. SNU WT5]